MPDSEQDFGLHPFRITITATLCVESPLHLGDGEVDAGRLSDEAKLSTLLRGVDDAPFIPGSSLKGLLRGLAGPDADMLFGTAKSGPRDKGRMSHVIVWGGAVHKAAGADKAPYGHTPGFKDSFAAARTAINPATGTADEHKLFFQEMLAPGTEIPLDMLLVADSEAILDQRWQDLNKVLRRLAHGGQLGKGKADGQGRVRLLTDGMVIKRQSLGADGLLRSQDLPIPDLSPDATVADGQRWVLTLTCPGPFAVLDSSRKPVGRRGEESGEPALNAQTLDGKLPHIPGTSLMGALRAQARWLKALEGCVNEDGKPESDCPKVLNLFGTTRQRGRLRLEKLSVLSGKEWNVTSVKLDRFSGAPIDGALFTTRTYTGVKAEVELCLDGRADDESGALVKALVAHLLDDGLLLGHGTNKGFGWFDVTVKEQNNG